MKITKNQTIRDQESFPSFNKKLPDKNKEDKLKKGYG